MANVYLTKNSHFAILALFSLCIDLKTSCLHYYRAINAFAQKSVCSTFLAHPCTYPRRYWIISSLPCWISKILFVLGIWDDFGSQESKIIKGKDDLSRIRRWWCHRCTTNKIGDLFYLSSKLVKLYTKKRSFVHRIQKYPCHHILLHIFIQNQWKPADFILSLY